MRKLILEERMNALTDRYTFQFASMEQSIAGLQRNRKLFRSNVKNKIMNKTKFFKTSR